jgi:hypothetical protein
MVLLVKYVSREICFFQGLGFLKGSYVRRCPKVLPFFVHHNSHLTIPNEVILSFLEFGCGELPLVYHFNFVAPNLHG